MARASFVQLVTRRDGPKMNGLRGKTIAVRAHGGRRGKDRERTQTAHGKAALVVDEEKEVLLRQDIFA